MARVTVEDCIDKIPNRFELVMAASQRVRDITAGAPITVDRDRDKNPVVALREIAEETLHLPDLEQDLVKSLSRVPEPEPVDEEVLDLIPTDQNIFGVVVDRVIRRKSNDQFVALSLADEELPEAEGHCRPSAAMEGYSGTSSHMSIF